MILELYYTSAPKGLKPGTTGFCTVAHTGNMPEPIIQRLESLSGYRAIFKVGSPDQDKNPHGFAHWRVEIGGQPLSVLSHVCFAGADSQGRTNNFAYHIVLDLKERKELIAGPAWVMMQPGVMAHEWSGEPRALPPREKLPDKPNLPGECKEWAKVAGDAGWAGRLVEAFLLDASKPAYIIYPPGMDVLPLMNEAIALLPEDERWQVTFNTYFYFTSPPQLTCSWRCCVAGTDAAKAAPSNATSGVLIDLTSKVGKARKSKYVLMARGKAPSDEGFGQPEEMIAAPASAARGWTRDWSPATGAGALDLGPTIHDERPEEAGIPEGAAVGKVISPTRSGRVTGAGWFQRWRKRLVWVAALLVLGGGWLLLLAAHFAGETPALSWLTLASSDETEMVARLRKERETLKSDLDRSKNRIGTQNETITQQQRQVALHKGTIDKLNREKAKLQGQLAKVTTSLETERQNAKENTKLVEQLRARLKKAPGAHQPTTPIARTDSGDGGAKTGNKKDPKPVKGDAKVVDGAPWLIAAKLPEPVDSIGIMKPSKTKLASGLPGGARVKIFPPILRDPEGNKGNDKPPKGNDKRPKGNTRRPFWSAEEKGAVVIWYEQRDQLGGSQRNLPVARAEVSGGNLLWEWKDVQVDSKKSAALGEIIQLVRDSVLRVVDDKDRPIKTVQFCEPKEHTCKIGEKRQIEGIPAGRKPRSRARVPNGWKQEQDKRGLRIKSNRSAAAVLIGLLENDRGIEVSTSWAPGSSPAEVSNRLKGISDRIGAFEKRIKNLTDRLAASNKRKGELEPQLNQQRQKVQKIVNDLGIPQLKADLAELTGRFPKVKKGKGKHQREYIDWPKVNKKDKDKHNKLTKELREKEKDKTLEKERKKQKELSKELVQVKHSLKALQVSINQVNAEKGKAAKIKKHLEFQKKDVHELPSFQVNVVSGRSEAVLGMIKIEKKQ